MQAPQDHQKPPSCCLCTVKTSCRSLLPRKPHSLSRYGKQIEAKIRVIEQVIGKYSDETGDIIL